MTQDVFRAFIRFIHLRWPTSDRRSCRQAVRMTPATPHCCSNFWCITDRGFGGLRPDTEQTRELQFLVEVRRKLVDDNTCFSNRLTAQLKLYYPQVLTWFYKVTSPVTCDFLMRWPTLQALQKA